MLSRTRPDLEFTPSFNPLQIGLFPAITGSNPRQCAKDWDGDSLNAAQARMYPRKKPSVKSFASQATNSTSTSKATSTSTTTVKSSLSLDKPLPDLPRGREKHKKPPITDRGTKRRDNSLTRILFRGRSNSRSSSEQTTRPPLAAPAPSIKSPTGSYSITARKAVDPANATNRITMPPLTGELKVARLAEDGTIRTGSWRATVRYSTTHEGFADRLFIQGLLIQLHHLCKNPEHFLELLIERYAEQPPEGLTDTQQRVWEKEARDAQGFVIDILVIWLREFYNAKRDAVIVKRLQNFVMFCCQISPSHALVQGVSALLEDPRPLNHREIWRQPFIAKWSQRVPSPTDLLRQLDKKSLTSLSQLVDSSFGSEAMAQHLTEIMSLVYRASIVDPVSTLDVLFIGKSKEINRVLEDIQSTERAISLFALHSILDCSSSSKRSHVLEFWATCGLECIQLNNYSSAGQIYDVLASGAVSNLWTTIGQAKEIAIRHYRELRLVFGPGGRYQRLTPAIGDLSRPFFPHLPPMMRVLRAYDSIHERKPDINIQVPRPGDAVDESLIDDVNMLAVRNIANIYACLECAILPYNAYSNTIRTWIAIKLEPLRGFSADEHFEILRENAVKTKTLEKKSSKLPPTVTDPWEQRISLITFPAL